MKILHFADLHLGVETYGRINPETGVSSRLEDFLRVFDEVVTFALDKRVDLVLFSGDAYKSREPSQTQQREFAKRIRRLSEGSVPVFLLIGNHDSPNTMGRATSTEIFDTLAVRNVYVASKPDVFRIPTQSGTLQIVALPWLRRSALLAREDTRNLGFEDIKKKLEEILTRTIGEKAQEIDPKLPAILAAHVWVAGARVGSEKGLTIGQEHTLLLSNLARPEFDYVALGHIHRHQVLATKPTAIYAGSLERLDFGDEDDEKGFYLVEIATDANGKRQTSYDFHRVSARRFYTIRVNIDAETVNPTAEVIKAVSGQAEQVRDAIVRLEVSLTASSQSLLRDSEIRDNLKEASYFTISRNVVHEARRRLGERGGAEITPLSALRRYLELNKVSPERIKILLEQSARLLESVAGKKD
ncbi:MAG: exonuclease SbcCD subunit D [Chloroflexota bacterium]